FACALAAAGCGLLGLVAVAAAGEMADGCCPAHCEKKVCVPVEETKTVTKTCYTCRTKEFCKPCSMLGMLFHKCDCSKVYHRKVLIMKDHKSEKCVTKGVPVAEGHCGEHCGATPGPVAAPAPAHPPAPASAPAPGYAPGAAPALPPAGVPAPGAAPPAVPGGYG